jgi:metal-responsive CopG/Arc/MetJ family transcriptional regulator
MPIASRAVFTYNHNSMRTTIAIDEELIEELMRVEGQVSRSEAIRRAVEDYLRRKRIDEFMTLAGSKLVDLDWREAEREELRKVNRHGRKR